MEKEYTPLIDRKESFDNVNKHFKEQTDLLVDLVNYGSNLLPRCFTMSNKGITEVVVIGVLFKQALSMLDAFEVLFTNGVIQPSYLQTRALFEVSWYMEYILKEDSERRAKHYFVSNLRNDRFWSLRGISGTKQKEKFDKIVSEFSENIIEEFSKFEADLVKQSDSIAETLQKDSFREINESFEKIIKDRKLDYEPPWHTPLGLNSVRQVANNIGKIHEYETFYAFMSEAMHSSSLKAHVKLSSKEMSFEQLRFLKNIKQIFSLTVSVTLRIYRLMLETYRPGEVKLFSKKYVEEWRKPFTEVKDVTYKYDDSPIKL